MVVKIGDLVVVTEDAPGYVGEALGEVDRVTGVDPGDPMGLRYELHWWGWVKSVRPATQEELAKVRLASLEGL